MISWLMYGMQCVWGGTREERVAHGAQRPPNSKLPTKQGCSSLGSHPGRPSAPLGAPRTPRKKFARHFCSGRPSSPPNVICRARWPARPRRPKCNPGESFVSSFQRDCAPVARSWNPRCLFAGSSRFDAGPKDGEADDGPPGVAVCSSAAAKNGPAAAPRGCRSAEPSLPSPRRSQAAPRLPNRRRTPKFDQAPSPIGEEQTVRLPNVFATR